MSKVLAALAATIILATAGAAQAQNGWLEFVVTNPVGAKGVRFSVKHPASYVESEMAKPGVHKEFYQLGNNDEYLYFLSITVLNIGRNYTNTFLKTDNGVWITEMVEELWKNFIEQLNGVVSYTTGYYDGYPACDIIINQSKPGLYNLYREIDYRLVMYNNILIGLQCGDVMMNKGDNKHKSHVKNVCQPFFASLAL
jgi:hypothetical protein